MRCHNSAITVKLNYFCPFHRALHDICIYIINIPVHISVYTHVYIYTFIYICIYICTYTYVYIYLHTHMYIDGYTLKFTTNGVRSRNSAVTATPNSFHAFTVFFLDIYTWMIHVYTYLSIYIYTWHIYKYMYISYTTHGTLGCNSAITAISNYFKAFKAALYDVYI